VAGAGGAAPELSSSATPSRARARGARGSARDENEFEARALVASHVRSALGFRV